MNEWIQDRSGIKMLNLSNTKVGQTQIGNSRKQAKASGYITYHGKPCVHDHTEKYTSSGHCVICRKVLSKKYQPIKMAQKLKNDSDKDRVIIRKNKNKHEKQANVNLTEEQIHENIIESQKNERRKNLRKYNVNGKPMTEHDWLRMYEEQGGKCANSKCTKTSHNRWWEQGHNGLCVDHDHVTGEVFELLCMEDNTREGIIDKSASELYGMIEYHQRKMIAREIFLEKSEKKT